MLIRAQNCRTQNQFPEILAVLRVKMFMIYSITKPITSPTHKLTPMQRNKCLRTKIKSWLTCHEGTDLSCTRGLNTQAKEIRSHPKNIPKVITNIVSNHLKAYKNTIMSNKSNKQSKLEKIKELQTCDISYSWVSWVILGNVPFNLAYKINTNIGSFCVDTFTHSSKEGHGRSTKAITSNSLKKSFLVITITQLQEIDGNVQHQKTIGSKKKTHDYTRFECSNESLPNTLPCLQGCPGIRVGCNFHPKEGRYHRGNIIEQKGYRAENCTGKGGLAKPVGTINARLTFGTEALNRAKEDEDKNIKSNLELTDIMIFSEKERSCFCYI